MKQTLFLIFGIILLFLSACGKLIEETENNDTFFTANPISLNQSLKGHINYEGDNDIFLISNFSSTNLFINISLSSPSNIDLKMQIYKNKDMIKEINSTGIQSNESLYCLFLNTQNKYYISLSSVDERFSQDATYSLLITENKQKNLEQEPNDVISLATPFEPGTTMNGYFSPSKNPLNLPSRIEEDWYKVKMLQDNLIMRLDVTSVPNVDFSVAVYDNSGAMIRYCDDNPANDSESLVNIGLHQKGWYYICVQNKNFTENLKTPYKIITDIQKHETHSEFENNDNFYNANSIQLGELETGYINPKDDIDFYKIEIMGNKPYVLNANISPVNDIDFVLEIYDKNLNLLQHTDNEKAGGSETIPNLGLNSTPTYIKVFSKSDRSSDTAYTLTTKLHLLQKNEEFEQNNNTPTQINVNSLTKGYFSSTNDIDYYFIKITDTTPYKLKMNFIYNSDVLYTLYKSNRHKKISDILFTESNDKYQSHSLKKGYYIIELKSKKFSIQTPYAFIFTKL